MNSLPHVAIICLGSNVEPRREHIARAISMMQDAFDGEIEQSSVYETPSLSGKGDAYLNQVIRGRLAMTYDDFIALSKRVEKNLGRSPESKGTGKVTMDVDVVILDEKVLRPFDYEAQHFRIGYKQLI